MKMKVDTAADTCIIAVEDLQVGLQRLPFKCLKSSHVMQRWKAMVEARYIMLEPHTLYKVSFEGNSIQPKFTIVDAPGTPLHNRLQARSQGGGGSGGSYDPPPVAHPKDFVPPFSNFVPPFSNFVPPFSNFVPPFSNFVPPFSNFVPPFSNFVPPFSNFVPPLEYVDDVTRAMSKGGGACECPRVGAFFKLMTSRGQCPRGGGAPGVPPIQVQTPPTWLAGYGPEAASSHSNWESSRLIFMILLAPTLKPPFYHSLHSTGVASLTYPPSSSLYPPV